MEVILLENIFNLGKIGEKVTSDLCTIVDDGTLKDLRGSLNVDDEGVNGQYNTLIEKGVLKGYMQDKLNARLMGVSPTGNGRRESYAHLPMPRMTNTYMLPGQHTPEEIISTVKQGLYAPNFGGGQVDITSGKFVFSTSEAYLIENGKITRPVKGATLIGSGIEAMQNVSMVGNDLSLDRGVGVCGKTGDGVMPRGLFPIFCIELCKRPLNDAPLVLADIWSSIFNLLCFSSGGKFEFNISCLVILLSYTNY